MSRINLLPWREERRKQRQQEFYAMLGVAAGLGLLFLFGIATYITNLQQGLVGKQGNYLDPGIRGKCCTHTEAHGQ